VTHQRSSHIAEHRFTMAAVSIQFSSTLTVTHDFTLP
jgi:hypothetical protein